MVVGYEVGNDYDIGARLLAKYLSKQFPASRRWWCRTGRRPRDW